MSAPPILPAGLTKAVGPLPLWFCLLLLVNFLVVAVYWLIRMLRHKKESESFGLRALVMLLCPVVGALFYLLGWLWYRTFFHRPVDLDDVIFSKERTRTMLMADEEHERNLVPLEEAIAVTDQANTRMLMMEVVRRDISDSLASISLALESDDSEVSHYAASVLQETLGNLRMSFQKLWRHICELEEEVARRDPADGAPLRLNVAAEEPADPAPEPDLADVPENERENALAVAEYREEQRRQRSKADSYRQALLARDGAPDPAAASDAEKLSEEMEDAHALLDHLRRVLRQKVLTEREQARYTDMMEDDAYLIDRRDVLTAYELESLISALLQQEEYERCGVWCARQAELYPRALSSFTCRLRLCYAKGDRAEFFAIMDELKRSDVSLDHETLEMIRVFL